MSNAAEQGFPESERFEMLRRLGEGGASVVYQAYDRERETRVAVKVLRDLSTSSVERIEREFLALKDLRHPNLVQLGELFREDGKSFFTMELVEGCDFLSYVRPPSVSTGYDEARLREALRQLAAGVSALHRFGKVHRDIKPSNVLVTGDGRVVLVDFDLVADVMAGRQLSEVEAVGTTAYMAPEQSAGKPISASADWYSVGIVLYQALTGALPFSGSVLQIRMEQQLTEPPPPRTISAHVPADLDTLCSDLLRYDPRTRLRGRKLLERLGFDDLHAVLGAPSPLGADTVGAVIPFVGREQELDALMAGFEESRRGQTVTVLISGAPGLGKTVLVRQLLSRLEREASDVAVLAGRCYQSAPGPFKGFDTIIESMARSLESLNGREEEAEDASSAGCKPLLSSDLATAVTHLFPALHLVPAIEKTVEADAAVPNPQELRSRAFVALRELLVGLALRRPLVMFLDDLQWADTDSVDLVREIIDAPESLPLLFVATLRSGAALGDNLARVQARARELRVGPLADRAARELAEDLCGQLGLDAGPSALDVATEARGHPLFIVEMVRHVASSGRAADVVSLEDVLRARIDELPDDERGVLELIALAGTPLDENTLADAAQLEAHECVRAVALLLVGNLVRTSPIGDGERVEPYHNRVRETVLSGLDDETRKKHHWNLARVLGLSSNREHREAVVQHLEGAGENERAAQVAERAATRASESLAFAQAAEFLRVALRLGSHSRAERCRLQMVLGSALCNAGRGAEASAVYLAAVADADATSRIDLQRRAAEQLLLAGHFAEGFEQLRLLLAEVDVRLPSSPRLALLSLVRQRALLRIRGLRFKERHEKEISPSDLARCDAYQAVSDGLAMVDNIRGADFQSRSLVLALRLGERRRVAHALCMESIFLASQGGGRATRARSLIDEAGRLAERSKEPYIVALTQVTAGILDFLTSRYARAIEQLRTGEVALRDHTVGSTWQLDHARQFRMHVLRHTGEFAELRRLFEEYVRDAEKRGDLYMEATMRRLSVEAFLYRDLVAEARENLARAEWSPPEGGFHMQHYYELLEQTKLALYEGSASSALEAQRPGFDALDRSMLTRIQVVRAEAWWMRSRLQVAVALQQRTHSRQLGQAASMARRLAKLRLPYATIWSQLIRGAIATQKGEWRVAIELLRSAIDAADKHAMPCMVACGRKRLGSLLKGDEGAALVLAGDEWMASQGVVNPDRITDVYAPGFASR